MTHGDERYGKKQGDKSGGQGNHHMRDDGGLHLGSGSGHSKKYLGSGYILKVEPTEFTDGLKEVWKRGVKDEF